MCACDVTSDASLIEVFTFDNGLVGSQVLRLQSRDNETLLQLDNKFFVADAGRKFNFTQKSLRFIWSNPMNEIGFVLVGIQGTWYILYFQDCIF